MDELRIRVDPPNDLQGDLVIKVLINGKIITKDDYCLDVESFFSGIGKQDATLNLTGGCGVPECCGDGYDMCSTAENWQLEWSEGRWNLSWTDAYNAAAQIIPEIERLPKEGYTYKELNGRLPFYREKLDELKKLAGIE